jgi:hypothetical protein
MFDVLLGLAASLALAASPTGTLAPIRIPFTMHDGLPSAEGRVGDARLALKDGHLDERFLKNYTVAFDYTHSALLLFAPTARTEELAHTCGRAPFHIDVVDGVAQARFHTDAGERLFMIDTGSTQNVLRPTVVGPAAQKGQASHAFATFNMARLHFGRTHFALREFAAPDVDGVLGTPFLQGKTFCVDAARGKGWIKR